MEENDYPETGSGPADPQKVKEFWLDTVVPAERAGKLDKIPAGKAVSKQGKKIAQTQNYYLTRRSFGGFSERYNMIRWKHTLKDEINDD